MAVSLNDLSMLDVTQSTQTVEVAGATLTVRPLSIAERNEIDAILPLPLAPKTKDKEDGRIYRDETADGYEERAEAAERARRALQIAVAADLFVGDFRWTRESLAGRRPSASERKAMDSGHPDRRRLAYADAVVPEVFARLGDSSMYAILAASAKAESAQDDASGKAPSAP